MTTDLKVRQGTTAWFELPETLMSQAASRAGLSPELNASFLERYTDGVELSEGLFPSFRVGVRPHERADIIVNVTAAAARKLNTLHSADPNYQTARDNFLSTGAMRVVGNPSRLGGWLERCTTRSSIVRANS